PTYTHFFEKIFSCSWVKTPGETKYFCSSVFAPAAKVSAVLRKTGIAVVFILVSFSQIRASSAASKASRALGRYRWIGRSGGDLKSIIGRRRARQRPKIWDTKACVPPLN